MIKNAVSINLDEDALTYFIENCVRVLEPDNLPVSGFPTVLKRFADYGSMVIVPSGKIPTICIPFDILLSKGYCFKELHIPDMVTNFINEVFSKEKWVASARNDRHFFAVFERFNLDFLNFFATGNMVVPFFVFDKTMEHCFGYDCDFEYCFLSSTSLTDPDDRIHGSLAEWDEYFLEHFPPNFALEKRGISYRHKDLLLKYLLPSLPRKLVIPERILQADI